MKTKCWVKNCSSAENTLHNFPDPNREPARYSTWVVATANSKITRKDPAMVYRHFRIFRAHFAPSDKVEAKRLAKNAVLKINIPGKLHVVWQIRYKSIINYIVIEILALYLDLEANNQFS